MTRREERNDIFARTSFLDGTNAAYIERLYENFLEDPRSVDGEWRAFFTDIQSELQSVSERKSQALNEPSWARDDWPIPAKGELVSVLDSDWRPVEKSLQNKIRAGAKDLSADLTPEATHATTQDSIRALMLIRAYRVRGHLAAKLDPLNLTQREAHPELQPESYGFGPDDLDRPIFIDNVLGLETATMRQILEVLNKTYCSNIGVEFMHISDPEQKSWIQAE